MEETKTGEVQNGRVQMWMPASCSWALLDAKTSALLSSQVVRFPGVPIRGGNYYGTPPDGAEQS